MGGCLGTRLYLVLLGAVSASSSWKKDWSSLSATSSRDRGFGEGSWDTGSGSDSNADLVVVFSAGGACSGVFQSHPIVMCAFRVSSYVIAIEVEAEELSSDISRSLSTHVIRSLYLSLMTCAPGWRQL